MFLKTLAGAGKITLKDYPESEFSSILLERNGYVLLKIRNFGRDYGGSQSEEEREMTYEEIIPERILVENRHFRGVCIFAEYERVNGGRAEKQIKEAILLTDEAGKSSVRAGMDFANDDHSRWDYTDYYLTSREKAEELTKNNGKEAIL